MKLINTDYKFLVLLYAYLHQMNLSLDRARWYNWSNLKEYYKSQINAAAFSKEIQEISGLTLENRPIVHFIKPPSFFSRMNDLFSRVVFKRNRLSDIELLYCAQLLRQFDLLLGVDFPKYPLEAEKLRIDIADFYDYILRPKLSRKDLYKASKVEHFMQNEILVTFKIEEFIPVRGLIIRKNLCSIKPVNDTHSDRNYMQSIINTLFNLTKGKFYVEVSRPNYHTAHLKENLKQMMANNKSFNCNNFEISFFSDGISEELIEILPQLWFAYEHTAFCFFVENEIQIDIKRKPWSEITTNTKSYILYKGIEEDVLWIGKSNELKFDLLQNI